MQRLWTREELEYLRRNYGVLGNQEIAQTLNRSIGAIWLAAQNNNLAKKKPIKATIPTEITPEISYILGALCGDGNVSGHRIILPNSEREFVEEFQRCINIAFKTNYEIKSHFHKVNFINKEPWEGLMYSVSVEQKNVVEYINSLGKFGSRDWRVPSCIRVGTLDMKASFIRGLFDSEATVHMTYRAKTYATIDVRVVNPAIYEVIPLLTEFEIRSKQTFSHFNDLDYYGVAIHDLLSEIFYDRYIGFSNPEKAVKLKSVLRLPKTGPCFKRMRDLRQQGRLWSKEDPNPPNKVTFYLKLKGDGT